MTQQPKISIIILNWNGLKDTLECLTSLSKITYPNYEIVVVDNGSQAEDIFKIRQKFPSLYILKNKTNLGFAEGNNVAIRRILKQGQSDYILLLNNDTVVTKNFLNHLVETAQNYQNSGALGPKIYYYRRRGKTKVIQSIGSMINLSLGKISLVKQKNNRPQAVDFVTGACLLIKTAVVKKIGLLDKRFFCVFEDADWCLRVKTAGFLILYVPRSVIYHKLGQTIKKTSPVYYYTRNLFWFEFKHANSFQLLFFLLNYFIFIFPVYFFGYLLVKKNYALWKSYTRGVLEGIFACKR
ncbi:MAG: glycosyltransferase family 2 protein [Candidatus Beckwithbacteria bacterium]|nr:glycosyltransferase family 2 protein [Candidatus Beckwithbacteria bacterium]